MKYVITIRVKSPKIEKEPVRFRRLGKIPFRFFVRRFLGFGYGELIVLFNEIPYARSNPKVRSLMQEAKRRGDESDAFARL